MLQKLGDHIAACYARAAECEDYAATVPDASISAEYLEMAQRWTHLAKSYEFAEALERSLLDIHKKGWPFQLENLPKPPEQP